MGEQKSGWKDKHEQTCMHAFKYLKLNSRPGSDSILSTLHKIIKHNFTNPTEDLFNYSIQNDVFPDTLKESVVVLIYKSGGTSLHTNFLDKRKTLLMKLLGT